MLYCVISYHLSVAVAVTCRDLATDVPQNKEVYDVVVSAHVKLENKSKQDPVCLSITILLLLRSHFWFNL